MDYEEYGRLKLTLLPFANYEKVLQQSVALSDERKDYQYLYDAGAVAIFGPGSSVAAAGKKILEILIEAYKED